MAYMKRAAEDTIAWISEMFLVLLVIGHRQMEKNDPSAETQRSKGLERKYITLDDPDVWYLAKHDPALFCRGIPLRC